MLKSVKLWMPSINKKSMLSSLSLQQTIWSLPSQVTAETLCLFHCSLHISTIRFIVISTKPEPYEITQKKMRIRERFPKGMKSNPWNTMMHWEVFSQLFCANYIKSSSVSDCAEKKSAQDVAEMKKRWVRWCLSPPLSVLQCLFFLNMSCTWIVLVLLWFEGILFIWRVVLVLKY